MGAPCRSQRPRSCGATDTVDVATTRPAITDQDLRRLPKDGRKYELVDGEIRLSPAGARHGRIAVRLTAALLAFVGPKRLGEVFDSSTGYRLPGCDVRSPDASFVATKRLAKVPEGFLEVAPDLAVEVLSPDDSLARCRSASIG